MTGARYSFGDYCLDLQERQLRRADRPVELSGRYLDALALLVREAGRLVPKDRFMDEVWRGVPVTDEALTQCIRTLRRQLGDDAARPRFIETVPKYGYRFIAGVEEAEPVRAAGTATGERRFDLALAGTLGGAGAGLAGGLVYGFAAAATGMGAASVVSVVACVTVIVAAVGGFGVSAGMMLAGAGPGRAVRFSLAGGALGGLVTGALFRLVGMDAFSLLLGRTPAGVAGPFEGVLLGGAVGLGAGLALREFGSGGLRRAVTRAALLAGAAGLVIPLLGGRLMAGSLDLLARAFPESRLRLDPIGRWFGEDSFGPLSSVVTGTLEAALFGACIVGAMMLAVRRKSQA